MPTPTELEIFTQTIRDAIRLHELALKNPDPVLAAARMITESLRAGGKLLLFGNGGSAADAQHVAAELVGRFERDRTAMAAMALTTDTSILTSVGNDYTFDRIFARQIEGLGRKEDVALGISTSGHSKNVLLALQAAHSIGMKTIALTGNDGGLVGQAASLHVNVATDSAARAQEVHRTLLHVICGLVERA